MRVRIFFFFAAVCCIVSARSQKLYVQSPNQKIMLSLFSQQNAESGKWYLKTSYSSNGSISEAISQIALGLSRSDQDFSQELKFLKVFKSILINEQYSTLQGKKSLSSNSANEVIVLFENPSKAKLNSIIRAYNDDITFRYGFPEQQESFTMKDEFTSYGMAKETMRWTGKWNPANEGLIPA